MLNYRKYSGFTFIELVVVIILISILSLVALPRFFSKSTYDEWGFTGELSAALRYAQKLSIASGCNTEIDITATGYQLMQQATCNSGSYTTPVVFPGGGSSGYSGTAPNGITLTATNFYFDPVGRPRNITTDVALTSVTTVTVGSRSIAIEPETGFVHLP